LVA
jgi:hypothetical protein